MWGVEKAHAWSDAVVRCCEYLALHASDSKRGALSNPALIQSHDSIKENARDLPRCKDNAPEMAQETFSVVVQISCSS